MAAALPRPRFPVVLFDLDGCLIDTNHLILESFRHTLSIHHAKLGLRPDEVTEELLLSTFGQPLKDFFGRFAADKAVVDELVAHYRQFNLAEHDRLIREIPGIFEAVVRLRDAGVTLAIVTSKFNATAKRGLACCRLDPFFPVLVGLDDTDIHKPAPEPALHALKLLGENPGDHVLMVGDSMHDVSCGNAAGCRTAAVGWTAIARDMVDAAKPSYWVESPEELVRLILGQPEEKPASAAPGSAEGGDICAAPPAPAEGDAATA